MSDVTLLKAKSDGQPATTEANRRLAEELASAAGDQWPGDEVPDNKQQEFVALLLLASIALWRGDYGDPRHDPRTPLVQKVIAAF
jgi:hypothetical protein